MKKRTYIIILVILLLVANINNDNYDRINIKKKEIAKEPITENNNDSENNNIIEKRELRNRTKETKLKNNSNNYNYYQKLEDNKILATQKSSNNYLINESYSDQWNYVLPSPYNSTIMYADYLLADMKGRIIANSTKSVGGLMVISTKQETHYSNLHGYKEEYFIIEITSQANYSKISSGLLEFSLNYEIPDTIPLGHYYLLFQLYDNEKQLVNINYQEFNVLDSHKIRMYDCYLYQESNDTWLKVEKLVPSVVSPGDQLKIFITLKNSEGKEVSTVDDGYLYPEITMGKWKVEGNATLINTSKMTIINGQQQPEYMGKLLIEFTMPTVDYRGNITIKNVLEITLEWDENNTAIETYKIITEKGLIITCDYKVKGEFIEQLSPCYWIGEELKGKVNIFPVKGYNDSLKIKNPFIIPEVAINCYFNNCSSNQFMTKKLYWSRNEDNPNQLIIAHPGFGINTFVKYYYPSGEYLINVSWGKEDRIITVPTNSTPLTATFLLKENYRLTAYDSNRNETDNLTITVWNYLETTLLINILFEPTNLEASTSREYIIIYNETFKWVPKYAYSNYYQIIINKSLSAEVGTKGITLRAEVKHSNGSIIKVNNSLMIYFISGEKTTIRSTKWTLTGSLIAILLLFKKRKIISRKI